MNCKVNRKRRHAAVIFWLYVVLPGIHFSSIRHMFPLKGGSFNIQMLGILELKNQVSQSDVTLLVSNSKVYLETFFRGTKSTS